MSDHAADLVLALELADLADRVSMDVFRSGLFEATRKVDGSDVTIADTTIERLIRDRLAAARPHDEVLGEEFGGTRDASRVWMVDPIDGTASFARGGDEWATLISLVEDGVPVVGVVASAVTGRRWWAASGCGAFADGAPMRVSDTATFGDAVLSDDFRCSVLRGLTWTPLAHLAPRFRLIAPWRDRHSFVYIGAGVEDLLLQWWSGTGPDLTGPICILTEAGGRFSDLEGRLDIDAEVQIVSNGHLHDGARRAVHELIDAGAVDPTVRPVEDVPAILTARTAQPAGPYPPPTEVDRPGARSRNER